jgi:formyltetrahydrofolate deformylase
VHQFTDERSGWFFARMAVETETLSVGIGELRAAFEPIGSGLRADWTIRAAESRMKVVLMVSRLGHCLADLLWRWRCGELAFDIACVVSNHEDFRAMVEREGLEFRHVPIDSARKEAGFAQLGAVFEEVRPDLIVLARYMQVLPDTLCAAYPGRIMNIHHSFLPSFVGANPYQRAWERGVKLIGATCHYATADLDQGPIIDQEVTRVEHFHSPEDLVRIGRDCERLALARSVRWHLGGRVFVSGNRTIVLRD